MNTRDFLDILHIAEKLKDTPRHCTTSRRRVESVAEHSWRVSLMASLLKEEFPELDMDKVVHMCLIHDLGHRRVLHRGYTDICKDGCGQSDRG